MPLEWRILNVGDWVKVKKVERVPKGESAFSEPLKVVECFRNSARLSDNRIWHMSRIAKM